MSSRTFVSTLVLPLKRALGPSATSQRASWLWSSWENPGRSGATTLRSVLGENDLSLESKFELMSAHLSNSLWTKFMTQWRRLQSAPEGSLKNRWYKFIVQVILQREDPRETFLKSVPLDGGVLDITYPDHLPEKLVRRRLRLLAMQGRARHRRGVMLWSLAFIPQMPLMVTPLPNISVYYTLYRLYSHVRALKGSFMLGHGFSALDAKQLVNLREQLARYEDLMPGSWPHKLVTGDRTYKEFFRQVFIAHNKRRLEQRLADMLHKSSMGATTHGDGFGDGNADAPDDAGVMGTNTYLTSTNDGKPPPGHVAVLDTGLKLYFAPSAKLRELLQGCREVDELENPRNGPNVSSNVIMDDIITEETVARIGEAFQAPNLAENVSRFRKNQHYEDISASRYRSGR